MKKSRKDWSNNERNSGPRTILIQGSKKLKNTCIFIYENLCKDTMELCKQLWEKVLEHQANNKI